MGGIGMKDIFEWSYTDLGDSKYRIMWTKLSSETGKTEVLCSAEYRISGAEEEVQTSLRLNAMELRQTNAALFEEEYPEQTGEMMMEGM